jgi:hypothetical protein
MWVLFKLGLFIVFSLTSTICDYNAVIFHFPEFDYKETSKNVSGEHILCAVKCFLIGLIGFSTALPAGVDLSRIRIGLRPEQSVCGHHWH